MKLNSKLWMLAVALATVGCQDDLENVKDGGGIENGLDGEKTYISVSVNTSLGTRALPGETGDGSEEGTTDESMVNDVTVFLFRNGESGLASMPSTDYDFTKNSTIIASGFAKTPGGMSGGTPVHSNYKKVEMTVTVPEEDWANKYYGVIAIANLGEEESKTLRGKVAEDGKNVGETIADEIPTVLYSHSGNTYNNFLMSTHTMGGVGIAPSISYVQLKKLGSTEEAPSVDVYVERLAAQIRISDYVDDNNKRVNFTYSIPKTVVLNGTSTSVNDVVILNHVSIVNQLTSGTYMIKRVSDDVTGTSNDIPSVDDVYLGDENPNPSVASGVASNFVIDPWTSQKEVIDRDATTVPTITDLTYDNRYVSTGSNTTIPLLWNNDYKNDALQLYGNDDFDNGKVRICYTQENTSSVDAQQNGYSTGALFAATYYPGAWGVATSDVTISQTEGASVFGFKNELSGCIPTDDEGSYTAKPFLVYDGAAFKDEAAIFAYTLSQVLRNAKPTQDDIDDHKYYTYADFDGDALDSDFDLANFKASVSADADDIYDYIAYLKGLDEKTTQVADIKTFSKYISDKKKESGETTFYTVENVDEYEGGQCFYPYWIRHANNNNDNVMGIMEFGIVRNNIYDLSVQSITGFGLVGTPEPGKPDEDPMLKIKVVLYVRDWTLRTNEGIVL